MRMHRLASRSTAPVNRSVPMPSAFRPLNPSQGRNTSFSLESMLSAPRSKAESAPSADPERSRHPRAASFAPRATMRARTSGGVFREPIPA